MSIQVFIRCAPRSAVREELMKTCFERWKLDYGVDVVNICGTWPDGFQWTSRVYAEERAEGPYYILSDDDTLILGENWAKRAVEAMEDGYGLLSGRSMLVGERIEAAGEKILEYPNVGCPCVIRKGAVDYRELSGPPNQQDAIVCEAMHKAGYRTGFIRGLDYIHAGMGLSQVEPKLFLRY